MADVMNNHRDTIMVSAHLQAAYDEQYSDASKEWRELGGRHKAENIIALCKHLGSINRLLEVGAGEGSILMHLDQRKFCPEMHALEISKSGIDIIKNRNISRLHSVAQFDGYRIPYDDNQFNLVILSHVLEHVEYPRILLREIQRVSTYQFIEIPCDYSYHVDRKTDHFISYGHINIYPPPLLRFDLKSEGFVILRDKSCIMAGDEMDYLFMKGKKYEVISYYGRYWLRKLLFRIGPRRLRESLGNAYAVLCTK